MAPTTCIETENSKDKIIHGPKTKYIPEPGGMGEIFFSKMKSHGDAVAQIDGLTGEKDTYASLLKRCVSAAITMHSKGITPEDIITICTFNHLNSCVPFIASLFLGVKTANLDPTLSVQDTVFLLKQVRPKMIFVGPEATQLIENALGQTEIQSEIVVFGNSSSHVEFSEFLEAPVEEEQNFEPVHVENLKATAIIFFSSGTTGLPKGICVSHLGILGQSFGLRDTGFNMEIFLAFSSMYWISSAVIITYCTVFKCCRVVVPKYDPNMIWELLEKFKVTSMFLAPSQAVAMYKKERPQGHSNSSHFIQLLVGGGPISKEQLKEINEMLPGTKVLMGYGLTEVSGLATLFQPRNPDDMILLRDKPESAGRPIPGFSYKVVHPETEEVLGPNQKGELRIKTEFQMNGYYKLDSSTAWDGEGFLKTGDVGYYDEDQCFFIVDRLKEMLKFQSWHVPPAQLEGVLLTHPAIEAAVVVGLPHPEDGDHPMGVVVLKSSFVGKIGVEEIERYVEERVHDRMRLRGGVRVISSIPVTPTGKMKRRDVRDMVLCEEI